VAATSSKAGMPELTADLRPDSGARWPQNVDAPNNAARDSYTCPKCHLTSRNPGDVQNYYCGHCDVFAEDLRNEVVTDFDHIPGAKGITRKECFSLAVLSIFYDWRKHPEARVCHAWVSDSFSPGEYVLHAWCEAQAVATYDNGSQEQIVIVHDYTQIDPGARFHPRDLFYQLLGIDANKVHRYSREDAFAMVLKNGTDGPWEDIPR